MKKSNAISTEKIIDWDIGVKLAGGKLELAENILSLLMSKLPGELHIIKQAWETRNIPKLKKQIHNSRGAISYCGVPRLNQTIQTIEQSIKKNHFKDIPQQLTDLELEIKHLLEQQPKKEIE